MSRPRRFLVVAVGLALSVALCVGVVSLAWATPVPPVKQGPVASYSFDENTGTTVHDLSGDKNEGTVEGATWARGRYGNALEFDGNTTCVSVPDSETLQLEEEFTLEAWVRPEGTLGDEPLIFKEAEGGPSYVMGIGFGAGGKLEGYAEGEEITSPHYIADNAWVHLAFTYDGNRMRLFEDGELVANKLVGSETMGSSNPLRIGCWPGHEYAEARIDEVRVYERALNVGEIGLDMETPLQTPKTGPVADWSFDEGSGTSAADDTGHGHTMTLNKATWAGGRYGDALRFDGKKGCASAAASSELDFTEEFTLEAWVRPESEGLHSVIAQEDESAGPGEDPFAYTLLSGDEEEEGPRIWVRESGGGRADAGGPPIPQHAWSHLAVTDDGAHLRFYVDGELVDTEAAAPLTTGTGPLSIGCIALYGDHFKGRVDEVRAYDRVLNTGEVDADMGAPIITPKTGPIAAYSFDEGEAGGTAVQDVTGDGHTATIHGAEWTTHGEYGGALEFDAEDEDFVSIPASGALDSTEQLTVEAWVRPTESPEWASILMKERESGGPLYTYALYQHKEHAGGHFEESEEGELGSAEGSLPQGAWTHLAITDDGAWSRLYVNGELVDTEPALPLEGHGEIRIGGNEWWGEYFDGRIDEVRIYDRALNGAEIATDVDTPLQTPETGPVAVYSFDAGSGSTLADLSGHENNGTISGATWTPNGRYGSALEFNGSSNCVEVPNSESLQLGEEFTLEAWVRPEGPLTEDPIFFKENDPELGFWEIPSYWMYVGFNATGKPQGYNEEAMVTGPNAIHDNTWTHLAFTYDGHALHVYVNGELEASNPISGLTMSSTGPLYIGCSPAYEEFFHGRIDEARIYERALSQGEVHRDSETSIQTPPSGPIAGWSFDEGEGTTSEDVTGNEHEATLEGPTWSKGKYGDALAFNGPGENCVKVPDSPSLQLREDFTIEAWVKPQGSPEYDPIIWKETGTAASYTLAMGLQGGQKAEAYIGEEEGASYERAVSPSAIEPNVWSHIAATYDGVHLRLYVNGEQVASKYTTTPNMASSGPLYIGCAPDFNQWFGGRIDEVRIFSRAMTPTEAADITGPKFVEQGISIVQPPGSGTTFVLLPLAVDPQLPNGQPGSGVQSYRYRYSLNYGPMGAWQTVPSPSFVLTEAEPGEVLTVQAYAIDRVGNDGYDMQAATTIPEEAEEVPLMTEQEQLEAEEDDNGESFPGDRSETMGVPSEGEGEGISARVLGGPIVCEQFYGWPHNSTHKRTRINVVIEQKCPTGGPMTGFVRAILYRDGRVVSDSGERAYKFGNAPDFFRSYANDPCIANSKWRSFGEIKEVYPPDYIPPEKFVNDFSPLREIKCGKPRS